MAPGTGDRLTQLADTIVGFGSLIFMEAASRVNSPCFSVDSERASCGVGVHHWMRIRVGGQPTGGSPVFPRNPLEGDNNCDLNFDDGFLDGRLSHPDPFPDPMSPYKHDHSKNIRPHNKFPAPNSNPPWLKEKG